MVQCLGRGDSELVQGQMAQLMQGDDPEPLPGAQMVADRLP